MAYQHPDVGRAKARTLLSKTGHRPPSGMQTGGKMNADFSQDKRMVDGQLRKAFAQHNKDLHGGKGERLRLADGGMAMGGMPMMRGDRAARGKPKKSGNNVNVIIAGKGAGDGPAPPSVGPHPPVPPAMGMAGPGGPGPMPPMPPPGPPPGGPPGGPPGMPPGMAGPPKPPMMPPGPPGALPPGMMGGPKPPMPGPGMPPPPGLPMRKAGGRTGHDPKIAKEAKEEGESYKEEEAEMRAGLASGGRPNMTAGIGSGAGRLELSKKIKY